MRRTTRSLILMMMTMRIRMMMMMVMMRRMLTLLSDAVSMQEASSRTWEFPKGVPYLGVLTTRILGSPTFRNSHMASAKANQELARPSRRVSRSLRAGSPDGWLSKLGSLFGYPKY